MESPRTPGTGIAGDLTNSLGGEQVGSIADDRFPRNDCRTRAAALDRVADLELAHGHHNAAEMLARKAEALRTGGAA